MSAQVQSHWHVFRALLQRLASLGIILAALGLVGSTLAAALGLLPWLEIEAGLGGTLYPHAGQVAQTGLTVFAVLLCAYLPANARIMALETSHRRFGIGMRDIARAYRAAHDADRAGLFRLSAEFDAVRERLAWLRAHPDLGSLEPDVLEVAAQMSQVSRDLAETYSDEKVARAHAFLQQRQEEIASLTDRIARAKAIIRDLRHWAHEVDLEESVVASQIAQLREDLQATLPEIGFEEMRRADGTVIDLGRTAAE